jgi:hypothetical protein
LNQNSQQQRHVLNFPICPQRLEGHKSRFYQAQKGQKISSKYIAEKILLKTMDTKKWN